MELVVFQCSNRQMNKISLLFILLLWLSPMASFAQTDSTLNERQNVLQYFDDVEGINGSTQFIKFGVGKAVMGEYALFYERQLGRQTSFEVGFGYLTSRFRHGVGFVASNEAWDTLGLSSGFSFSFQFKAFAVKDAPNGFYLAPMIRLRQYFTDVQDMLVPEFRLMFGHEFRPTAKLSLNIGMGFGYVAAGRYMPETTDDPFRFFEPSYFAPLNLTTDFKIGYAF